MADDFSPLRRTLALSLGAVAACAVVPAWAQEQGRRTYSETEIARATERFFGGAASGLADVVHHVFAQNGEPVGYIEGGEGSGAIGVGLRYGDGRLHMHDRENTLKVYWRGPSIGFDTGGDAAKVFTLIYGMTDPRQIYRRFPGVDGSAYFVGGVGANYQRAEGITLAPIRAGVGFRLGANIGYLAYSPRRIYNPF